MIVIIAITLLPVYADSFNVSSSITQSPSSQNRTAIVVLSYSGGITRSIEGTINYDSDFFESVSVGNSGNWSVRHTGTRFIATNTENSAESGQFAVITATVKSDTTLTEGEITLTELESGSTGEASNKTIKVTMQSTPSKPKEEEKIPETPENPGTPESQEPATTENDKSIISEEKQTNTPKSTTKTTQLSNVSTLPKTGIISGIGIAILAAVIVAIIELIKYKKITK